MSHALEHERRYIRQSMLAECGEEGQRALSQARVLVVGAGGLGAPLLTYLAAAGVGTLGIIDPDRVELSNLNRQTLFEEADTHRLKVDAARDTLEEQNSGISIRTYAEALRTENAHEIMSAYDIIADGCDDFTTRFIVNAACVALGKPLVSASVTGWNGQVMGIDTRRNDSPCYHCFVHPNAPDANNCTASGVMGAVAGVIGSMQALEVIRTILDRPALIGKVALFNGLHHTQRLATITRDSACPVCSTRSRG